MRSRVTVVCLLRMGRRVTGTRHMIGNVMWRLKLWEGFTLLETVRQDSSSASPFPKGVCSGSVIFGASHRSIHRAVSCCPPLLKLWESLTLTQDTQAWNERIPRLWPCRIFARNMTRIFCRLRLPRLAKDLLVIFWVFIYHCVHPCTYTSPLCTDRRSGKWNCISFQGDGHLLSKN